MFRLAQLSAFLALGFAGAAASGARADLHLIALDGSDKTVKPEDYGYKVDVSRSGEANESVTIRLALTEESAKSFEYGELTLTKRKKIVVQTSVSLDGRQRLPDNKKFLAVTFDSRIIDDGELIIWSQEIKGQPIRLGEFGGFSGFRLSIKTMLARTKAADKTKPEKNGSATQPSNHKEQRERLLQLLRDSMLFQEGEGPSADKEPMKGNKATHDPTEKELREQLLRLLPNSTFWMEEGGAGVVGPIVLRGILVRKSSEPAWSPRERKVVQLHAWSLEARVDSALVRLPPLTGISGNEKLEQVAHQLAGKEVILAGTIVWVENHFARLEEGKPYPVIKVDSVKPARPAAASASRDEGPTSFNVEVQGILRVNGKLRKIDELESPTNINSPASAIDHKSIATGALIATRQMGDMEVYFGGDQQLQDKAKGLNGKMVRLSGRLERVTYYSKQEKERIGLLYGGGGGTTQEFWREVPALVTKTYIRVIRLEAAEQPDSPAKAVAK